MCRYGVNMADSPGRTSKQLYPSAADLAGYNQQLVDRFQSPKDPSQFSSFTLFPERDPKTSSESPSFAWQDLQGFSSPSTLQQSGRPLSDFSPPTPYRPTYEDFYSRGGNPQELSPPITNPLDLYPPGGPLDLSPPVQPLGSVGSYNGYSSHYQASADNHLFDLSEARHQGFDIYSKSLEEWNNFSEYSPFGSRQTISYSPVQEKDSTNKPSYSEVARTLRAKSAVSGKAESESSKRKVEVPTLKPIRSFKKPFIKPHHHFKGRSGVGEPPSLPVHPDSKYGLDQFDDLSLTRKNSLGCCSTVEEKTSSIESLDKIGHLEKYTNNRAGPNSVTEEIHLTSPISFQGNKRDSPSPCQDSRLKEKGSKSCSSKPLDKPPKMANTNSQSSEAKPFFDPKRIFQSKPCSSQATAKKSQSAGNSTSSSASSGSSSTVLNNGKVSYSSKPSATAHKRTSDYINNDLRDTRKKSSNHGCTKREHDTPEKNVKDDTCSGKFCSKPDKSKGVYTRQSSKPRSAGNVSEPNGSSSSARLREGEESSSRPIIDQELIDEWLLTCQEKFGWLCRHAWSILVTIVVLLITLIAFIVSNLFVFVGKICSKVWTFVPAKLFRGGWDDKSGFKPGDPRLRPGLDENIILPTTGEEAMQRLFACKGKDPYSILGLHFEASDEEIKKYYKRQAVLVHPDKNQQAGAEEAFKILGHAFELIGEPDKRRHYDSQLLEATEAETAMQEFADLLTKLQEKIQEAANMMRCDNCGGKHRRVPVSRPWYSARFCDRCNQRHSVKEGDVWAETSVLGFLWHYYACMEGKVYDITEWVKCRSEFFKHMQPNAHHVFYRIATEGNRSHQQGRSGENDLEDFINHLFHRAMNAEGADSAQWPGQKHGATTTQSNGKDTNVRRKRKKKKH